jgi:hypothetical protein
MSGAPHTLCKAKHADIHGLFQLLDLLRLFEYGKFPPEANYLFLSNYVDRGKQSLETIGLLLAYKIKYPENFLILRGNHECASINRIYGFYDKCGKQSLEQFAFTSHTTVCCDYLSMADSHQRQITSSSAIMWTQGSSPWKQFAFFSHTR